MTTDIQPHDERPIRNGAKPAAYNYLLSWFTYAIQFLGCGLLATVIGSIFYAAALLGEIIFTPLAFASWCYVSCIRARAITSTKVGERIPAQHGLACLAAIWLRASPTYNLTVHLFPISKPESYDQRCQAGCLTFHNCWTVSKVRPND